MADMDIDSTGGGLAPALAAPAVPPDQLRRLKLRTPAMPQQASAGLDPDMPADPRTPRTPEHTTQPEPSRVATEAPSGVSGLTGTVPGMPASVGKQQGDSVAAIPGAYQRPLEAAKGYAAQQQRLGTEPATLKDPRVHAHHGWRKALDYTLAALQGGLAMNPAAGVGMYRTLSRAPLHEAQEKYQSEMAPMQAGEKQQMEFEKGQTGEDRIEAERTRAAAAEETAKAADIRAQAQIEKFSGGIDANSIYADPQSPTGFSGRTFSGTIMPVTPRGMQKPDAQPKTFDEAVIRANMEPDPVKKAQLMAAAKQIQEAEKRKFQAGNPRQPGEFDQWRTAKEKELGRPLTSDEMQGYKVNRPPHAKDRQTFELHWRAQFDKGEQLHQRQRQDAIKNGAAGTDDEIKTIDRNWDEKKQQMQEEKDAEAAQYGVYQQASQPGASQIPLPANLPGMPKPPIPEGLRDAAAPPAAPPAAAQAQPQAGPWKSNSGAMHKRGDQVLVGGKQQYITGYNQQTGKFQTSDQPPTGQ